VFVRVVHSIGEFSWDERGADTVPLEEGDIYVVRYRSIQQLVRQGHVELI